MDEQKFNDFLNRFVGDLGATVGAGAVVLGDQLGLYRALAEGPRLPTSSPRRRRPLPATWRNGCAARPPAATSPTTPPPAPTT